MRNIAANVALQQLPFVWLVIDIHLSSISAAPLALNGGGNGFRRKWWSVAFRQITNGSSGMSQSGGASGVEPPSQSPTHSLPIGGHSEADICTVKEHHTHSPVAIIIMCSVKSFVLLLAINL